MKPLALALLLVFVIPIMASHEPMRIRCFKHRGVETVATGVTRFNEYGHQCEFEHEQYPGKHKFFESCLAAARVNKYILKGEPPY
jgi:hypothetical protein